jgi:hypothetical protein
MAIENAAGRDSHHVVADRELENLNNVIGKMEDLVKLVSVGPQAPTAGKIPLSPTEVPSLNSFLGSAGDRIRLMTGRVEKALAELRELLY